jgi:hypothetical protein
MYLYLFSLVFFSEDYALSFQHKEEKLLSLIKLQTFASIITNNLRRQEYLT